MICDHEGCRGSASMVAYFRDASGVLTMVGFCEGHSEHEVEVPGSVVVGFSTASVGQLVLSLLDHGGVRLDA